MEQYSRGTMLVHPNNTIISHRHLDVFVDDTSLGITSEAMKRLPQIPDSPVLRSHDIRLQLQHNMAFYNCLLNLTGGALAWKNARHTFLQGYTLKLMMIIGHWQKKDTVATILDIVMGTSQQQVGISTPILETAFDKYGFLLEDDWIKRAWIFLKEMQGKLVFSNIWTP